MPSPQLVEVDDWIRSGKLAWVQPGEGEREPAYSGRVLVPRLRHLLSLRSTSTFVVKGDGRTQQNCDPVWLAGKRMVPDIAIDFGDGHRTAYEVKFFRGVTSALKEAIGQAAIYRTGHYETSRVLLVSLDGNSHISPEDLQKINRSFSRETIQCFQIFRHDY